MALAANTIHLWNGQEISDAAGGADLTRIGVIMGYQSDGIGVIPEGKLVAFGEFADSIYLINIDATFLSDWSNLSDWRIEEDVHFRVVSNFPVVFAFNDSLGTNYCEILNTGSVRLSLRGVNYETATGLIVLGNRYRLALSFDGTDIRIHIDEVERLKVTVDGSTGTITKLWVGRWTSPIGINLFGTISKLRFKNSNAGALPSVDPPPVLSPTVDSSTQISFTWPDDINGIRYLLYFNTTDTSVGATLATFADQGDQAAVIPGLAEGTEFFFFIKTVWNGFVGPFGASVSATTNAGGSAPGNPTSFAAAATTRGKIRLTWVDGANTDEIIVHRNTVNTFGTATIIAAVLGGVQLFDDVSLADSTQFFYWITAQNANGNSATIGSVNATTIAAPVDLLTEIGNHLIDEGIVDGATGWLLQKSFMPSSPAKVVALFETPGEPAEVISEGSAETAYDQPTFQVRVRGDVRKYSDARSKMQQVFLALQAMEPGANFVYLYSNQSGPMPMGDDKSDRPEMTWNFVTFRAREE